jgi:hypothetical protein
MAFEYKDEIKNTLLSMSLDERFPAGAWVGYGFEMGYSASSAASASINLACVSSSVTTTGSGSLNINGITLYYTGSNVANNSTTIFINTSLFANNSLNSFIVTSSIVFNVSKSVAPYSASLQYITASVGSLLNLTSVSTVGTVGNNFYYISCSSAPTVYFQGGVNLIGSVSGAVATYDENIYSTGVATLQLYIPSSSYLDSGSEVSSSIATIVNDYTDYNWSGSDNNLISTQIVVTAGGVNPLICNNVNCYTADNGYWIYGPLPTPLTLNDFTPNSNFGVGLGNRQMRRPIVGGVSITSTSKIGSVGTMGLVCQDSASGALVGLTNNHVIIRDPFYTDQRTFVNPQNEYDLLDANSTPDLVYQDGENAALLFPGTNREVGRVLRYVPLYTSASTIANPTFTNKVDGAIFSLYCTASDGGQILSFTSSISHTGSFQQYGLAYSSSMPFATTAEINNLLNTNPVVYSSGRTSGAKGSNPCPLRITGFTNATIAYPLQGVNTPAYMQDLIAFVKPQDSASWSPGTPNTSANLCPFPAWYGDSGSTLIAEISGVWKIIGLVFAGNSYPFNPVIINGTQINLFYASDQGYACRIDHVASELGIKAWTGSAAPVVDNNSITYITVSGSNDDKILNCSGSAYWQVGLTTKHKFC